MGTKAVFFLASWTLAGPILAAPGVAVRVELTGMGSAPAPREAVLSFYRTGKSAESALRVRIDADRREVELPEGSWEVTVTAEGYWSPPQVWNVAASRAGTLYPVPLWPVGFVTGHLTREAPSVPFPADFRVRFEPVEPLREPELPRSEVACPVDPATGAFRCALPASHLLVSLRRPGHVPVYRSGLHIGRDSPSDFGTVTFVPGASLVAWVALDGARIEAGKGYAVLRPTGAATDDLAGGRRLAAAEVVVPLAADGFLQFTGLAAGVYDLEVHYPDFAPRKLQRIALSARQELALSEPVLVRRPVELVVQVDPPTDFERKPWKLEVSLRNQELREPLRGATDDAGLWKAERASPGFYHVMVESSDGNRFASLEHEVTDAASAHVVIKVQAVAVRGRLTLGDEPLAAELRFGTRFGSLRSALVSDAEGNFQGLLPRSGIWPIEIHSESPQIDTTTTSEVDTDSDDEGFVVVDVRLSDNRVFGTVQDEAGQALAKAWVALESWSGPVLPTTYTDSQGRFELRAVDAGSALLTAEKRAFGESWDGPGQVIQISDEGASGPFVFRLEKTRKVLGTVTAPSGPVTGTTVRLNALDPRFTSEAEVMTGPDGAFEVRFPAAAGRAVVTLEPPGYFFEVLRAEVTAAPLVLPVATTGGTLAIDFTAGETGLQPLVLRNGLPVPLGVLHRWATQGRSRLPEPALRIPRVAAGAWSLCGLPRTALSTLLSSSEGLGRLAALAHCVSGELPPGGELTLHFEPDTPDSPPLHDSPAPRHNPSP